MGHEPNRSNGPQEKSFLRRFTSFGIIGIVLTIAGAPFIQWAVTVGIHPLLANFIQAIVSIVLNFLGNEKFTWPDRTALTRKEKVQRYARIKAFTLGYNTLLFALGQLLFPVAVVLTGAVFPALLPVYRYFPKDVFAYWFSTGIIMIFNYLAGDRYVYGKGNFANSANSRSPKED